MRGAAAIPALLLAACSQGGSDGEKAGAAQELIWCALGGAKQFTQDCSVERAVVDGAQTFVVRHPDGAFHRLEVSKDGQQLLAADGADVTQSARKQDRYEVILGDARYVIPVNGPASASAHAPSK
ncbi:hypothetical protein [Novosphingobium sp.]|uniref:hypothetical protein n=1 Tax=Novosphingobium sp. TaxID=1874826 RepID=UPI0035AEA317